jgi:hypothetical protein
MDSIVDNDKTSSISEDNKDGSLPILQINPLTLMISVTPFTPVDDNQENILESMCVDRSQSHSLDATISLSDKKISPIVHMDEHSVAAWVQSTTTGATTSFERSPSLPVSMIDQITTGSRRNSVVSTLNDQQQQQPASVLSDTVSSTISENLSTSTDIQRSFSFPTIDQNYGDEQSRIVEEEEDFSSKFLAVTESEDSEVDKKVKKSPLFEESMKFNTRSPTKEQIKNSLNLSFHASVSCENQNKILHRQRHNSWNKNAHKSSLFQRSRSHKITTQPPPLIHSQISHKQFQTSPSMPTDTKHLSGNKTNQSSSFSDNAFLSTSTTDSPSSSHHLQLVNNTPLCSQFLSIPSSASMLSSDRLTSNISDASGRSGIESSNIQTSTSEAPRTGSIVEENTTDGKHLFFLKQRQHSCASTTSSRTASTESLPTSSSEDETHSFHKKIDALSRGGKLEQTPADQRLDVLRQLMWLLEKRPTIYPRFNLKHLQGTTPVDINKVTLTYPHCVLSFLLGSFIISIK